MKKSTFLIKKNRDDNPLFLFPLLVKANTHLVGSIFSDYMGVGGSSRVWNK